MHFTDSPFGGKKKVFCFLGIPNRLGHWRMPRPKHQREGRGRETRFSFELVSFPSEVSETDSLELGSVPKRLRLAQVV